MTVRDLLLYGEDILNNSGIDTYANDARLLVMHTLSLDYTGLMMNMTTQVSQFQEEQYKTYVHKRSTRFPCQYIIGSQDFMGYEFLVRENVLIPRQETELLVEEAIKVSKDRCLKVLDVCCGSGCIGISYKLMRKQMGMEDQVTLVDISDYAIELAKDNCKKLDADCTIVKSDIFENVRGKYDIIISNPPYIKTSELDGLMMEVRDFEPRLALDGYGDGLFFYDRIIREAREHLYEEGQLLFEIGYDQYQDLRRLFVEYGYSDIRMKKDYAGLDRVVMAVWRSEA